MDAAPRSAAPPGRVAETGLLVVLCALLAWAVVDGRGSRDDSLSTVGIGVLACAGIVLLLVLRGRLAVPRLDRAGAVAVTACVGLTLWAGVSISWSIAGDRSWEWLARGLVYLAFLGLALVAGVVSGGSRKVAALLSLVIAAALGWALLGVAVPSLFPDGDRIARLREPVGYWNALALLADAAIAFGLWLWRDRRSMVAVGGALLLYIGVSAVLLTQSRAGVVGALAVLALWLVRSDERLADAFRTLVAAVPGLLVAGWAFTRPALVEDGAVRADRVHDGRVFAALVVCGALLVATAAWRIRLDRLARERKRALRVVLVVTCAAVVVGGSLGLVAKVGNPYSWASDQVSGGECVNDPDRLADLCANNRLAWWKESLRIARDHPVGGSGAGTYPIVRLRYRDDATAAPEPHSVPLQLLGDLGAVGLALALAAAAGAAFGIRRGLRLCPDDDRWAATALASLVLAYGVHALVDYDLDFVSVTAPALVALGVLLAVGRRSVRVHAGLPGLAAGAAVAAAALLAVALPALAQRDVDRALEAADAGRIADAVALADRARRLNPLSPAAIQARAYAADAAGDTRAAVAWYEEATRRQPENPQLWYDLGLYHFIDTGDMCAAYQALNRAYTLDPRSTRWVSGGPLDVSRDAVNNGACEEGRA